MQDHAFVNCMLDQTRTLVKGKSFALFVRRLSEPANIKSRIVSWNSKTEWMIV
jgi:hypothetical protein